jgi:hypothetical protein
VTIRRESHTSTARHTLPACPYAPGADLLCADPKLFAFF